MAEALTATGPIWYQVDGPSEAPALLLSNSLGTTDALWDRVLASFRTRFRVIRYDTRGHGRSAVTPGPYSLATLGADAVAVLDAAGIGRAHCCGVSLGGLTGMWLGIHAPHRIDRLVLANTGALVGTAEIWNRRIAVVETEGMTAIVPSLLERWFTPEFRAGNPSTVAMFSRMLAGIPPVGYVGAAAAVRDADLREQIAAIRAPTLVVVGTRDPATPPALGELIRDRITGARLVGLDAAHLSNVEQPAAFATAVTDFLFDPETTHG